MAIEVVLPQLGESVVEGTITKWLVKEGTVVDKDQPLVEIATDKADSEISSPAAGIVSKILAAEGATVPVKSVLCLLEAGGASSKSKFATMSPSGPPPRKDVRDSLTVIPEGEDVPARSAFGGPLASPQTRKMARELGVDPARVAGSGDRGRVTQTDILRAAFPPPSKAPDLLAEPRERKDVQYPVKIGAKREGAGRPRGEGEDAAELQVLVNSAASETTAVYTPPIPNVGFGAFKVPPYVDKPGDQVVPFSRRRRITAAHMVYSKQTAPQVVTVAEVDMQATSRLRDAHKDQYKKQGIGLTYLAFIVHATALALKETPSLNARVLTDAYVLLRDINIGIAVDTKDGLVVPVIKRADGLNVRGIAAAIDEASQKSRDGKLSPDDMAGASFSVSNPGLKGNLFGGAIISQPNVGILRIGELKKRVVVVESGGTDTIAIHPVMYIALSYDHRVVDGVAANGFLWRVRELLEKGEFEL